MSGLSRERVFAPVALLLAVALGLVAVLAAGCGGPAESERSEVERVAEAALRSVMRGDGEALLDLVAPSFLERARAEMPDADPSTLGSVLLAGFAEKVPYAGAERLSFEASTEGDRSVVHVWGNFQDLEGNPVALDEGDALRVPLLREGGRWYVDLLDL
ncbi:MAG: hypothetical protein ACUVRX_03300 [Actinomycetota bacterium]